MSEKMDISFDYDDFPGPRIVVAGVGGAGCNTVDILSEKKVEGVKLVAINTDKYSLMSSKAHVKIQIGETMTKGVGTGGDPSRGREAAQKDSDKIASALEDADVVFIAAGLGGGTGTGAAPIVAELSKENGALTIAFAIMPFDFEGPETMEKAEAGLAELREKVDAIMVALNSNITKNEDLTKTPRDIFREIDLILYNAVVGLRDIIVKPADMRLDLSDIKARLSGKGKTIIGVGEGDGERKEEEALERALHSPILERNNIRGAKSILLHVSHGPDTTIKTLFNIVDRVLEEAKENFPEIQPNLKMGYTQSDEMEGRIRITLIATDFEEKKVEETLQEEIPQPTMATPLSSVNTPNKPIEDFTSRRVEEDWDEDIPYTESPRTRKKRKIKFPEKDYLFGEDE